MDAFDRVLGEHWMEWYTLYVDDLGVHGFTKEQAAQRGRVLETILTVLEKPFSDKTADGISSSLDSPELYTLFAAWSAALAFAAFRACLSPGAATA